MSTSSVSQKLTFDKLGNVFVDNLWLFLVRRGPSSVHDVHRKPGHLDVGDDYLDDVTDHTMHFYYCTTKLMMIINLMHFILMAIMLIIILIMKLILISSPLQVFS